MLIAKLRYLPTPLISSGVALVLSAAVAGFFVDVTSAIGAASGVLLVTASYTLSVLVIAWADSINTRLVLPFGVSTYVLKIIWIGLIMSVLASHQWKGLPAMGIGVFVGVATWNAAQIITVVRNGPQSRRAKAGMALPSGVRQE
ncbi:MAG TPA: hypothetical protein VE172_10335 [Stackebrandtia sp.]|uniref:hypothetical protein n=1 Tax=Stackebrandtia sp. TaxID=2023065 RepID=UPI002D6747D0|nr:hypothetical protein [Stackebrandtia sp.]HZE39196.1 hypothetical protein [Stackebrandtia sp.]